MSPAPHTPLDDKLKQFQKSFGDGMGAGDGNDSSKNGVDLSGESKSRVAYEIVIAPLFFGFIGYLLDQKFGTAPLYILLLFFVGFATGIYGAWKTMSGYGGRIGFTKKPEKEQEK